MSVRSHRATQTLVVNLERGHHELFLATLQAGYTGERLEVDTRDQAGAYLTDGRGFSLSSAGHRPLKGVDARLTAQEKRIFERFRFQDL